MAQTQTQPTRPAASHASKAKSKKRARHGGEDGGASGSRKRRNPGPERGDRDLDLDLDLDLEAGLNKKIGLLDSMLLADHLAQKTRRFGSDLKPVELSALDISREFICSLLSLFSFLFYLLFHLVSAFRPDVYRVGLRCTSIQ